ncbi:hypothetical protein NUW54_g8114 [Trametes sanguinea]|uniref:Uncharacterized protein n=1 Tax=Trametes sanguinea TaxID=158606 RepID=A0ACC1PFN0_9APHY|nr:hypothetical protein NUW54_g8114 [Trametes sanguinea]
MSGPARSVSSEDRSMIRLGRGRKRNVQVNTVRRGAIRGQVDWEPKHPNAKNGHIGLETSNSPATLTL